MSDVLYSFVVALFKSIVALDEMLYKSCKIKEKPSKHLLQTNVVVLSGLVVPGGKELVALCSHELMPGSLGPDCVARCSGLV